MTSPYRAIDESFANATGSDMRLVYGLGVPFAVATALIIAFALVGDMWLLAPLFAMLFVLGAIVIRGIVRMLDDPSE